MQVHDQPALQARFDAVFQILDLARRAVGGNHDLFALIHQRVERVEELFLRRFLAGDELDIIDHQHLDGAEHFLEIHHGAFAQGLHEAIHELFSREIQHAGLGAAGADISGDGVHQVRLAQTHAAIQEQRVEGHRAAFGDATGGGMGQLVRFADDEVVKGKAGIQRRGHFRLSRADGGGGRGICLLARCGGGGGATGGGHAEGQAGNRGADLDQGIADRVGIVTLHPVRDETRRRHDLGLARIDPGQIKRCDPCGMVIAADAVTQRVAGPIPKVFHSFYLVRPVPVPDRIRGKGKSRRLGHGNRQSSQPDGCAACLARTKSASVCERWQPFASAASDR